MHEFSLAAEIVEIVEKSAYKSGKTEVTKIQLEIGELAGVEEQALRTALESLKQNSIIKNAEIATEHTKGKAVCKECATEYQLKDLFSLCPKCNSYFKDIISGKEFNIISIEAE